MRLVTERIKNLVIRQSVLIAEQDIYHFNQSCLADIPDRLRDCHGIRISPKYNMRSPSNHTELFPMSNSCHDISVSFCATFICSRVYMEAETLLKSLILSFEASRSA